MSPDGRGGCSPSPHPTAATTDGLLVPPGAVAVRTVRAIEDVLFLRDEMANLCWAVERTVQGPSGAARDRARERDDPGPIGTGPVPSAQLDYLLQTGVPARWIPYLPRSRATGRSSSSRARCPTRTVTPCGPSAPPDHRRCRAILKDAESPPRGRHRPAPPAITRRADGRYLRWTTRRVSVGRGEGASRLAFDSAISRKLTPSA